MREALLVERKVSAPGMPQTRVWVAPLVEVRVAAGRISLPRMDVRAVHLVEDGVTARGLPQMDAQAVHLVENGVTVPDKVRMYASEPLSKRVLIVVLPYLVDVMGPCMELTRIKIQV